MQKKQFRKVNTVHYNKHYQYCQAQPQVTHTCNAIAVTGTGRLFAIRIHSGGCRWLCTTTNILKIISVATRHTCWFPDSSLRSGFSGAQCQRGRNSFSCNTHQGNFGVDAFSLFQRLSEAGERHNRIKLCTPITPSHLLTFRDAGGKVWTVNKNYHRHPCKCCVSFLEPVPDHRTAVVPLDSVYLHDASWQSHPEQEKGFSNFRSPFTKSQTRCCTHWKLAGRAMQFAFAKNIFQHGTELNHSQFTQSWGVFFFCLWTSLNGHWDKLLLVADCLFRNTATLYFVTATVISCSATVRRGKKRRVPFAAASTQSYHTSLQMWIGATSMFKIQIFSYISRLLQ